MVLLEGEEGEKGSGYSKKEAQQKASKDTLQRLRREPQFIDKIFAAKTARTQMEEEPAMAVPDTEEEEFVLKSEEGEVRTEKAPQETQEEEFDLSDLSVKPQEKSREDIIAEAEAAAFEDEGLKN
jgi:ribonuclease-3